MAGEKKTVHKADDRRKKQHYPAISDIDQKIISMYAKGMTTRQISKTIEDMAHVAALCACSMGFLFVKLPRTAKTEQITKNILIILPMM